MPIIDQAAPPAPTQSVAEAAFAIRQIMRQQTQQTKNRIERIKGLVDTHTKAALAAELGADGTELQALYNMMKDFADAADPDYTAPTI